MKFVLSFFLLSLVHVVLAQNPISCKDLKTGVFYFYMKNSPDKFVVYRSESTQKEVSLLNGDSTIWDIQWLDDCSYSLKFKSTSQKWSPEVRKLTAEHKFVYSIKKMTTDYYTYQGTLDKASNLKLQDDTIWLSEKIGYTNTELFKRLRNENEVRKMKDTSRYAILYVYRPGKLTNSAGNYLVFFDNTPLCVASNSSGFIFKIFKEGKFPISSRLFKDDSTIDVDIKFGQVYYIKSMIHWGISSRLYNFKLETAKVSREQGEKEFEEIQNR